MQKRPLIILAGPTAVGKTELSINLAKRLNGEIISADSMQVYKRMDIGTAKIMPDEMQGVKHYLVDEFEPWDEFNIAVFKERCDKYIEEIYAKGKIPILVGGTGFYIQAVLYNIDFAETEIDSKFREKLQHFADCHGAQALHDELRKIDPASADAIHPNNVKRVIRAIEYYEQTGQKISEHNETEKKKESPYDFRFFVMTLPREILYDRINRRVDIMRERGLESEVKGLLDEGCTKDMVSMQGLGYKEIIDAFAGNITMDDAFEKIKQETRHFAKRQFTWFRREKDVTWLDKSSFDTEEELLEYCVKCCDF